jgi:hypothetical protein
VKTPILSFRSRPNVVFDPIVPDVAFDPIVAIECLETGGARQRAQRAVARQPRLMGPSVEGGRGGEGIDGEPWESAREVLQVGESARVQVAVLVPVSEPDWPSMEGRRSRDRTALTKIAQRQVKAVKARCDTVEVASQGASSSIARGGHHPASERKGPRARVQGTLP